MAEFDLVKTASEAVVSDLSISTQAFEDDILECWVGPEDWSDRPTVEEIPGWEDDLWETSECNISWDSRVLEFRHKGRTFLRLLEPPTVGPTKLEELKGLHTRSGDKLPQGQNQVVKCRFELPPDVNLYGMGQRSGPLERRGLICSNWTTDSPFGHDRTTEVLYQAHPLLWGVTNEIWWALLYCHSSFTRFDLGQSESEVLECQSLGRSVCFQVHAADSPSELLASLRQTLKSPSPPPLWSLGFHQSRWGYKSATEIDELIDTFRSKELPLDVVHLDIDHMENYRSFTFNKDHFPKPEEQFARWSEKGVKVVNIIDPGLKFDSSGDYKQLYSGLQGDHFIKSKSGAPQVGFCWPDEALFPDFFRASTREWWAQQCQFYLDKGVAGLWIDMNEPAIFDKPFWTGGAEQMPMPLDTPWGEDSKKLDHLRLRNLYGSQMSKATKDAWSARKERPWVLTRSGFTGVGSQAWSWMGDNTSWWEHLALSFPQLASMCLVNSAFVGVDIGGFFGHCDAELYGAWIEASVVYPFMRAHSALGTREQHPWSFGPDTEEIARKALYLRYKLLPYLYSAALDHCGGGEPIMRPMFFDYPNDQRFRYIEDQVMVGPSLMCCPFLKRGEKQRLVILPEGRWFDFHTGVEVESSNGAIIVERRPGLTPLFMKAGGAVVCFEKRLQSTSEAQGKSWEVLYCPAEEKVTTLFTADSGDGDDFDNGRDLRASLINEDGQLTFELTHCHSNFKSQEVTVVTASPEGWKKGKKETLSRHLS